MSENEKNPSVEVKITDQDMYKFNLYHTYTHTNGWMSVIIAIVAFVVAGITYGNVTTMYTAMYIILGIILIVYQPFVLRGASKRQILMSEALQKPLRYTFLEKGIEIHTEIEGMAVQNQEEEKTDTEEGQETTEKPSGSTDILPWNQVYKAVKNKNQILIYAGRANAYILPIEKLGDQQAGIEESLRTHLEKFRLKGI